MWFFAGHLLVTRERTQTGYLAGWLFSWRAHLLADAFGGNPLNRQKSKQVLVVECERGRVKYTADTGPK